MRAECVVCAGCVWGVFETCVVCVCEWCAGCLWGVRVACGGLVRGVCEACAGCVCVGGVCGAFVGGV